MPALTPIGLDIGSVSIRAVEVTRIKDRVVIDNFGHAAMPVGAVVGGVVKDERAVTTAVRELWAAQRFRTKSVVLSVSHQQVVVREIEIPNLPVRERRQALPFQVRDVLPLPVESALLDFYPLEDVTTKKGSARKSTLRGLLIAAPKEAVIDTVRAVEKAGLRVEQVDLACFAAVRATADAAHETEAIIDIGANLTSIVIATNGIPQMVRTVPRGGTEITTLMSSRLGMSLDEAESLKCRVGLVMGEGPDTAEVIDEAIRPLINEIRSSINYYRASQPDHRIARLALVGGAAYLPGLTKQLESAVGVPTYLGDPLQHVGDSRRGGRHDVLGNNQFSAATSVGLTLGAAS